MHTTEKRGRRGRGVTINLRADQAKRALIDRAAEKVGKNRSEFMLEAACRQATEVLLDQRLFVLDEKAYRRFTTGRCLDPKANRALPAVARDLGSRGAAGQRFLRPCRSQGGQSLDEWLQKKLAEDAHLSNRRIAS